MMTLIKFSFKLLITIYRSLTARFLNLVFGHGQDSVQFWNESLKEGFIFLFFIFFSFFFFFFFLLTFQQK